MATKKEVATTKEAALPAEYVDAMVDHAGAGMEEMTGRDFALPFIQLLQDLSPQVKSRDAAYVEGAEPGDFFNTVTQNVVKGTDGMRVIPVKFQKVYNEWIPRTEGGGFVATYTDPVIAQEAADPANEIVDTMNIFCLAETEFGWQQAILSFTKSKMKIGRRWNSLARMRKLEASDGRKFTPPYYGIIYRLKSVEESNDKGTFFNMQVSDEGLTLAEDPYLYEEAQSFLEALNAGDVGADFSKAEDITATGDEADEDY